MGKHLLLKNGGGFVLMILGGGLFTATEVWVFIVLALVGMFLFVTVPDEAVFVDYVTADGKEMLLRKRYYWNAIVLTIALQIMTLGLLNIDCRVLVYKQEYFKMRRTTDEEQPIRLTRAEYVALRNVQRRIYSTQTLSRQFMEETYQFRGIGYGRCQARLIVVCVLAVAMLTGLTDPEMGVPVVLAFEAVLLPLIALWVPPLKDAKILRDAYLRAVRADYPQA